MDLSQVVKVARREYVARVRTRAFVVMTVLIPVLMCGYVAVVPLLLAPSGVEELRIAVVDANTGIGAEVSDRLSVIERLRVEVVERVVVHGGSEGVRKRLTEAVLNGRLDGYLVLVPEPVVGARGRYYARETGNLVTLGRIERAIEAILLERLVAGTGVDSNRVRAWQRFDLDAVTVSDEGETEGGFVAAFVSTFALAMLLYVAVLNSGQGMALAIVEEKSSRLIEVILGAVTATEFMSGKIVGVLGAGLTQLGIWVGAVLLGLVFAVPLGAVASEVGLGSIVRLEVIVYFSIFFILGYFLYSVFFAVIAATCTSTEELGQTIFVAVLPMVVGLMSSFYVISNPAGAVIRVLSLLPPLIPFVMVARVNVLTPPAWEIWLGIVVLVLGIVASGWLAAKIFRYALLMHGKRPSLVELVAVIRAR